MTIRIMVADDHPIYRDGVVTSLEETGEFRVVGIASTAEEAVRLTCSFFSAVSNWLLVQSSSSMARLRRGPVYIGSNPIKSYTF